MTSSRNSLRPFPWKIGYSSDEDDLVTGFYEPAMKVSIRYDRAVGYFSSVALAVIAKGIRELYLGNGKIRLIASPALSESDIEAIRLGHADSSTTISNRLLEYLDDSRLGYDENLRLQLLSGMLADGLLDLRLAVREHPNGRIGLYHEKVGIFVDQYSDYISFIGSPNESWNGWVGNAESFALHTSWGAAAAHAEHESELFERTWLGNRPGVPVRDFPTAVREELFRRYPPSEPVSAGGTRPKRLPSTSGVALPTWLQKKGGLRDYQRDGVNAWLEAGGRGIFAMATGTGKTICALVAATQLWNVIQKKGESLLVTVAVPSQDLVAQWNRAAIPFGFSPIECHSGTSKHWPSSLKIAAKRLRFAAPAVEMVITAADTLVSDRFQSWLKRHNGRLLFIADELHSLGTSRRLACLPEAGFRLGLSATPQRHGDEEGTERLLEYFGEILQKISIRQAIELKALVPYAYYPIIVHLTDSELAKYKALSAKIAAKLCGRLDSEDALSGAEYYLLERAKLLGHAERKISALRHLMRNKVDSYFNLVYVAEGSHPINKTRQLDAVVKLLGGDLAMNVNTYTGETASHLRIERQRMLQGRQLQALIAMRCLDEGIDIPEARCGIILASTQNPRQFVQRRGRILRRDDKGGKRSAELYDLLVFPESPPPKTDSSFRLERRLVGRELTRALELASASSNGRGTPPPALREAMKSYDLLELVADYDQPDYWDSGGECVY